MIAEAGTAGLSIRAARASATTTLRNVFFMGATSSRDGWQSHVKTVPGSRQYAPLCQSGRTSPRRCQTVTRGTLGLGVLLLLELQRDVDELVLLAADQAAPTGLEQDLRATDTVALGLPVGVLEEGRVDAGV